MGTKPTASRSSLQVLVFFWRRGVILYLSDPGVYFDGFWTSCHHVTLIWVNIDGLFSLFVCGPPCAKQQNETKGSDCFVFTLHLKVFACGLGTNVRGTFFILPGCSWRTAGLRCTWALGPLHASPGPCTWKPAHTQNIYGLATSTGCQINLKRSKCALTALNKPHCTPKATEWNSTTWPSSANSCASLKPVISQGFTHHHYIMCNPAERKVYSQPREADKDFQNQEFLGLKRLSFR